jgi:competence protein ComEA
MSGAWLLFCLIALPRILGSTGDAGCGLPPRPADPAARQFVPGTNELPTENSASVSDKLPARFLEEPLVYFSTAPAESLVLLPGLGPVLAARICDSRGGKRSFESWDELLRVKGIGPKTVARLKRVARSH